MTAVSYVVAHEKCAHTDHGHQHQAGPGFVRVGCAAAVLWHMPLVFFHSALCLKPAWLAWEIKSQTMPTAAGAPRLPLCRFGAPKQPLLRGPKRRGLGFSTFYTAAAFSTFSCTMNKCRCARRYSVRSVPLQFTLETWMRRRE